MDASLSDEHLCPVVAIGHVAYADLGERGVKDIGPVAGGVHPGVNHLLGGALAVSDVLPGSAIGDAKGLHHVEGGAIGGAGMGEVVLVHHILGLVTGHPGELPVGGERGQAILLAGFVGEADDFALIGGDTAVQGGDVEDLSGVDQVGIGDLGIGLDDFAGAYLVLDGQLPHGVPRGHGVGDGSRRRRGEQGYGQSGSSNGACHFFHSKIPPDQEVSTASSAAAMQKYWKERGNPPEKINFPFPYKRCIL